MRTFEDLFAALNAGDETSQIEAKKAEELGTSARLTITAFSNEPGLGGGYLLLGVARVKSGHKVSYEVVGVPDPDQLQADLASQCSGNVFTSVIRPEIVVQPLPNGIRVVVVRIPEAQPTEKPVYIRSRGLPRGACRRIGSTDQVCSEDDIAYLYHLRSGKAYDEGIVDGASANDFDAAAIAEYRSARTELNPSAEELRLADDQLLLALGATVTIPDGVAVTRAGLLLFGKATSLRRLCPPLRIDYILVPGREWVPNPTQRYQSVDIRQPLILAIPRLINLVLQELPKSFQLKGKRTRRREIPIIPSVVIREAVVNAAMHRSYRANEPVQIIRFSNRLEIRNPGHSLVSSERLGEPGSDTRNGKIAAVLHDIGYAETKGTGIRVMRDQMQEASLTAPIFVSNREEDWFRVSLLTHHLVDEQSVHWLSQFSEFRLDDDEAKALLLLREMGYIDNSMYRNLNVVDVLTASTHLRRLRTIGLLKTHGKGAATFYTMADVVRDVTPNPAVKAALATGLNPAATLSVTPELVGLLKRIGDRSEPELLEVAILRLCAQKAMSVPELASLLGRNPYYLRQKFVVRLVKKGHLKYLYEKTPAHPRQAYVTVPTIIEPAIPTEQKKQRRPKSAPKLPFDD